MQVQSLGQEDPLEEEMATHCSVLAWEIPGTEEPGWAAAMGSQSLTRLSLHRPLAPSPRTNPAFAMLDVNISLYFTTESKENSR